MNTFSPAKDIRSPQPWCPQQSSESYLLGRTFHIIYKECLIVFCPTAPSEISRWRLYWKQFLTKRAHRLRLQSDPSNHRQSAELISWKFFSITLTDKRIIVIRPKQSPTISGVDGSSSSGRRWLRGKKWFAALRAQDRGQLVKFCFSII